MKKIIYVVHKGQYQGLWEIIHVYDHEVSCRKYRNSDHQEMIPKHLLKKVPIHVLKNLIVTDQLDEFLKDTALINTYLDHYKIPITYTN